ncbi:MAG: leucyl/phenylalanyl-tRNA--protein transferase [Bacteroidales bacterium]|nr:MAG: leucyl/phenylalanyl-tRNA--protein transferase [Bacteroidales bacterium]
MSDKIPPAGINSFPDPEKADPDGLLAVGGNLSVNTLINAYSHGIFPWYSKEMPILWWCPDPRLVLFPEKLRISKSLRHTINQNKFLVRIDNSFEKVIEHCASSKRKGQEGTWITEEMKKAYVKLYKEGYAHSFETYYDDELVGGLYGVSLGRTFFGESMFHKMTDASKVALYYLVEQIKKWNFHFIDAQQSTQHMKMLGAEEISRKEFLRILKISLKESTIRGRWDKHKSQ